MLQTPKAPAAIHTPSMLRKERRVAIIFVVPALLAVTAVFIYPMLQSLYLSFFQVELIKPWLGRPFVGLGNYIRALSNPEFWSSMGKTAYFTVVSVGLELIIGIIVGVVLNEEFTGRGFMRAIMLIPWAMLTITNGLIWMWVFNPNYGMFNAILSKLGILTTYRAWLADPFWAMHAVILADVWKMAPFMTLLILAGLQPIPDEIYEAADVDGASGWTKFRLVILPLLRPTILVAVVLRTMGAFKVFDVIYVMTSGGPANATKVISFYTFGEAFRYFHIGYGSALAWLVTLGQLLLVAIYIKLLGSDSRLF